jgi:taurine dioxygenase
VHPVLRRHPRTGQDVLYVSAMQTDRIMELGPEHSEALLEALWDVLYAPDNVYEHEWRVDDLVLWDNQAVQHGRSELPDTGARTLRRVTAGDAAWFAAMRAGFARTAADATGT